MDFMVVGLPRLCDLCFHKKVFVCVCAICEKGTKKEGSRRSPHKRFRKDPEVLQHYGVTNIKNE